MAETTTVTAEGVAAEFVATKLAVVNLIWALAGATSEPKGLSEWAWSSPVPLPRHPRYPDFAEEGLHDQIDRRSDAITTQMLTSIARWCVNEAEAIGTRLA